MQTIKYATRRVQRQTARNIRYGFPQRGRAVTAPGTTITAMAISLPLSAGYRNPWFTRQYDVARTGERPLTPTV